MKPPVSKLSATCLVVLLGLLASCAHDDDASGPPLPEGTEGVEVALTAIPTAMRCVRFTTVGSGRTFTEDFDVTGLPSLAAQVRGLPANVALSITADAYAVACAAITPTTQATWVSAPVAVTLTPGVVLAVLPFVLRPASGVAGDVDFLFLSSSPASRTFPSLVLGQTATVTFTVTNVGPAATGTLVASLTGTGANQFSIGTSTCAVTLAPSPAVGSTCTIAVTFAPTAAGVKTAALQLTGAPGGTLPVALTGTGVQPAVLALTPATQSFGNVGVGKSSPAVTYTVTNTGGTTTAPVDVTSSDATFVISASTCGVVLNQSQTCTFKVTFTPTTATSKSATITATAGTVTASATATGTGVAAPALTLTPSVVSFGTVFAGAFAQIPVTVKNVGGFPLGSFTAFVGSGTNSAPFSVDVGTCTMLPGGTLAPGATCMILVNIAVAPDPGQPTENDNATLLFNAGGATPASVMGTASATVAWPLVPSVVPSLNFGQIAVGTSSSTHITFTNVGPTTLGPLTFATGKPSVFAVTSNSCVPPFAMGPGAICDLIVRFTAPVTPTSSVDSFTVTPIPGCNVHVTLRGSTAP